MTDDATLHDASSAQSACEPDSPKRRQILDGARRTFLSKGFDGTSMQDVAKAAGVSKGTLYVYFTNKEDMFQALVVRECLASQQAIRKLGAGVDDVAHELKQIASFMLKTLLQPEFVAAMRMMIGAGEKFPELARHLYQTGPARLVATLAEYLAQRAARGDLVMSDPTDAAAEFVDLIFAGIQRRALLMMPRLSDDETAAFIDRRVARFLSVYRA